MHSVLRRSFNADEIEKKRKRTPTNSLGYILLESLLDWDVHAPSSLICIFMDYRVHSKQFIDRLLPAATRRCRWRFPMCVRLDGFFGAYDGAQRCSFMVQPDGADVSFVRIRFNAFPRFALLCLPIDSSIECLLLPKSKC